MLYNEVPSEAIFTGENLASASDCGRAFRMIYDGARVSEEYSAGILELLLGQTKTEKIPRHLPWGTKIAHKTGGAEGLSHDVGTVFGPDGADYMICVMTRNVPNADDVIAEVSGMVYNYYRE